MMQYEKPAHPLKFVRLWQVSLEDGWIVGFDDGELGFVTNEFLKCSDPKYVAFLQSEIRVIRVPENAYPIYTMILSSPISASPWVEDGPQPLKSLKAEDIEIKRGKISGYIVRAGYGSQSRTWVVSGNPISIAETLNH
jgi:hypothetical protein